MATISQNANYKLFSEKVELKYNELYDPSEDIHVLTQILTNIMCEEKNDVALQLKTALMTYYGSDDVSSFDSWVDYLVDVHLERMAEQEVNLAEAAEAAESAEATNIVIPTKAPVQAPPHKNNVPEDADDEEAPEESAPPAAPAASAAPAAQLKRSPPARILPPALASASASAPKAFVPALATLPKVTVPAPKAVAAAPPKATATVTAPKLTIPAASALKGLLPSTTKSAPSVTKKTSSGDGTKRAGNNFAMFVGGAAAGRKSGELAVMPLESIVVREPGAGSTKSPSKVKGYFEHTMEDGQTVGDYIRDHLTRTGGKSTIGAFLAEVKELLAPAIGASGTTINDMTYTAVLWNVLPEPERAAVIAMRVAS